MIILSLVLEQQLGMGDIWLLVLLLDNSKIPINLALLKGMKIVGVFWGPVGMFPEKNFEELFKLHSDGKINPEVSDSLLNDGACCSSFKR